MKTFLLLLPAMLFFASSAAAQRSSDGSLSSIPVTVEVGALKLPDTIAPVVAPFPMPQFKKPVFPAFSINITAKGARQGLKSTAAIQASIDEVNRRGGGMVIVPKGQWLTGRVSLKSNVNLHISEGAELHFSGDVEDYRPAVFTRHEGIEVMSLGACIYAYRQENIALTGKGKLVGPKGGSIKKQMMTVDVVEKVVPHDQPVSKRVYEGYNGEFIFLPMFVSPRNVKTSISRVSLWNRPCPSPKLNCASSSRSDFSHLSLPFRPALASIVIYVARSQSYLPPSRPFLNNLWPHLTTPAHSHIPLEMKSCLSSRARSPGYAARLSYR